MPKFITIVDFRSQKPRQVEIGTLKEEGKFDKWCNSFVYLYSLDNKLIEMYKISEKSRLVDSDFNLIDYGDHIEYVATCEKKILANEVVALFLGKYYIIKDTEPLKQNNQILLNSPYVFIIRQKKNLVTFDASKYRNISAYFTHLVGKNKVNNNYFEHHDWLKKNIITANLVVEYKFPSIKLKAIKPIKPNTILGFDYHGKFYSKNYKYLNNDQSEFYLGEKLFLKGSNKPISAFIFRKNYQQAIGGRSGINNAQHYLILQLKLELEILYLLIMSFFDPKKIKGNTGKIKSILTVRKAAMRVCVAQHLICKNSFMKFKLEKFEPQNLNLKKLLSGLPPKGDNTYGSILDFCSGWIIDVKKRDLVSEADKSSDNKANKETNPNFSSIFDLLEERNYWDPFLKQSLDEVLNCDRHDLPTGFNQFIFEYWAKKEPYNKILEKKHKKGEQPAEYIKNIFTLAIFKNEKRHVKQIIDHGYVPLDYKIKNKTPAQYARNKGYIDIANMIEKATLERKNQPFR